MNTEEAEQGYRVSCFVVVLAGVMVVLFYSISSPWVKNVETDIWISSVLFYIFRLGVLVKAYCEND